MRGHTSDTVRKSRGQYARLIRITKSLNDRIEELNATGYGLSAILEAGVIAIESLSERG